MEAPDRGRDSARPAAFTFVTLNGRARLADLDLKAAAPPLPPLAPSLLGVLLRNSVLRLCEELFLCALNLDLPTLTSVPSLVEEGVLLPVLWPEVVLLWALLVFFPEDLSRGARVLLPKRTKEA